MQASLVRSHAAACGVPLHAYSSSRQPAVRRVQAAAAAAAGQPAAMAPRQLVTARWQPQQHGGSSVVAAAAAPRQRCRQHLLLPARRRVRMASTQPDTEEARSPLDAPQVRVLCAACTRHARMHACMHACAHAVRHLQRPRVLRVQQPQLHMPTRRLCACLPVHTQEWEAPLPSKRPDIFPEFDKPERVFLPKPLPGAPARSLAVGVAPCAAEERPRTTPAHDATPPAPPPLEHTRAARA
jgi:hypothetical protein